MCENKSEVCQDVIIAIVGSLELTHTHAPCCGLALCQSRTAHHSFQTHLSSSHYWALASHPLSVCLHRSSQLTQKAKQVSLQSCKYRRTSNNDVAILKYLYNTNGCFFNHRHFSHCRIKKSMNNLIV